AGLLLRVADGRYHAREHRASPHQALAEPLPRRELLHLLLSRLRVHSIHSQARHRHRHNLDQIPLSAAHTRRSPQGFTIIPNSRTNDRPSTCAAAASAVCGKPAVVSTLPVTAEPLSVQTPPAPLVPITVTVQSPRASAV